MEIKIVRRHDELLPFMEKLVSEKVLGVDTETTGLNPHSGRIRLIQIACADSQVFIIDCFSFLPEGLPLLADIFSANNIKIFHNAKFDLKFLRAEGIKAPYLLFDTMLAARILRTSGGPERAGLKEVAAHYLKEEVDKEEQRSDWSGELTDSQLSYASLDAEILIRLREAMVKEIYTNGLQRIAEIEFQCVKAVAEMEYCGVKLDLKKWGQLTREKEEERNAALEELYKFSGRPPVQTTLWGGEEPPEHNFDNNTFVLALLNKFEVPVSGTSRSELSGYEDHPLVSALSDYRKAAKALSSFLYTFPKMVSRTTGRIHPNYGQISAASGRMSCYRPNIQQIPREESFRDCVVAPDGKKLVVADYSQIELRVAAAVSGDGRMTHAYAKGSDLHLLTASLMCGKMVGSVTKDERQAAKAVNFGLIYGMGAQGLMQYARHSYGVSMTLEEATAFRSRFFIAYPGVKKWHEAIKSSAPVEGRTLSGRKFIFEKGQVLSGYYNMPVQGTAADIMKKALGAFFNAKKDSVNIIAAIHDEIILECDETEAEENALLLREIMEKAGNEILKKVPCKVDVDICGSWACK